MEGDEEEDEGEEGGNDGNGGSPDDGMGTPGQENGGGNNMDDYEEIDYKICGELGTRVFTFYDVYRGEK
jgi:hypothetical protein